MEVMALGYFSTKTPKDTHVKTSIEMKFTKGPRLMHILGLAKTMLHEIRVSGTTHVKIPHLHIHTLDSRVNIGLHLLIFEKCWKKKD